MKCYTIISKVVTNDSIGTFLTIVSPTSGSPLSLHKDKWNKIPSVLEAIRIAFGTDFLPLNLEVIRNRSDQVEYTESDLFQFKAACDSDWLGISPKQVRIGVSDDFGPNIMPMDYEGVKTNTLSPNNKSYISLGGTVVPAIDATHDLGIEWQRFRRIYTAENNSETVNSDKVNVKFEGGLILSTYPTYYGVVGKADFSIPSNFKTEPASWIPITVLDKSTNIQKTVYFPTWEKI